MWTKIKSGNLDHFPHLKIQTENCEDFEVYLQVCKTFVKIGFFAKTTLYSHLETHIFLVKTLFQTFLVIWLIFSNNLIWPCNSNWPNFYKRKVQRRFTYFKECCLVKFRGKSSYPNRLQARERLLKIICFFLALLDANKNFSLEKKLKIDPDLEWWTKILIIPWMIVATTLNTEY